MNRNQYELYHYGVKGMKWGRRKKRDSKNAHNKNYTDKQRKNDRAFYGEKGEKRINKKLNEGYGLRGARHFEAERRQRVEKRKKTTKKVSKAISRTATAVGSAWLTDQLFYGGAGTRLVLILVNRLLKMASLFMKCLKIVHPD